MNIARLAAAAAATLTAVVATAVVQVGTSGAASAVTGLQVVWANSSAGSPQEATATVYCPVGKRVLGGGGGVLWSLGSYPRDIVLTQMRPVHPWSGQDSFVVTGERISGGTTDPWWVRAYAICADPLDGMHIVWSFSTLSSASNQRAEAECNDGEQVVGTGAYIYGSGGQVGLQVMRASTVDNLVYAQGHEDASGYTGSWYVMAVAVCADPIDGHEVINTPSPEDDSEQDKSAETYCPAGKTLYGAGAAAAFDAPGEASLRWITVDDTSDMASAHFIENVPTSADWDFIVSQAICAY